MSKKSRLGRELLKQVSRSFYLTLRLLPSGFREPMSVGYLLARATDTVADTEQVPVDERREALEQMRHLINGGGDYEKLERILTHSFAGRQSHGGERELLERFDECLAALDAQGDVIRSHTCGLLDKIVEGQSQDLVRFPMRDDGQVESFRDGAELDRYTYLVAGCVGEFWTEIGLLIDRGFPEDQRKTLLKLGMSYGQGLQLINILRDVAEDLDKGRCYLPDAAGLIDPRDTELLLSRIQQWAEICRQRLWDGIDYTSKIQGIRLQVATGLPALIGLRTLNSIESADWSQHEDGIKINRKEVKSLLRQAIWLSLKPRGWTAFAAACRRGV